LQIVTQRYTYVYDKELRMKFASSTRNLLRTVTARDYALSKRHLGILLLAIGLAGFIGILAIDVLDVGREGGIGPAQQLALAGCIGLALLGMTLIPLGDHPA
jgi:hypothetical protein